MSVINTNITSMIGQSNLNKSQNALQTSMERLSSGLRINSAKDDAAGQAIANRMTSQINGLAQAQRIRELSVQAANGTNSTSDLQSIQDEVDRISRETDFNGTRVLSSSANSLDIQVGSQDGQTISINLREISASTLGLSDFRVADGIDVDTIAGTAAAEARVGSRVTLDVQADTDGTGFVVKDTNGDFYEAAIDDATGDVTWDSSSPAVDADDEITSVRANVTLNTDALGANQEVFQYQSTADGDPNNTRYFEARISSDGVVTVGRELSTESATTDPLAALDDALSQIDSLRSELGAVQNRFEDAITNLSAARSRIEDADYAVEVANMTRAQILQQAGTSVLAQANQIPQSVLSLLG